MWAKTRSSNIKFEPPVTYDMVRSLFDPRLKKSFLEILIVIFLTANFIIAYSLFHRFGIKVTKRLFLIQYLFWRLSYNLGIGIVLHYQSHYEILTRWANKYKIFDKKNHNWYAKFFQFEIKSKLPTGTNIYHYPTELNIWLIFRQFVDLILMQDFITYMIFVILSLPLNNLSILISWKSLIGTLLILFNIWVKLDAHRIVKDFAWYWGDFFFLQISNELIFDGVFNISPHPMYSVGYAGYYGLSLITDDYYVLLVSLWGHFSQFLFLKYVESPHIERTYGVSNLENDTSNNSIDDLIASENYDYSRPLISIGIWFENFDKLRMNDIFTFTIILLIITGYIVVKPTNLTLFLVTFTVKLLSWGLISLTLYNQSKDNWFTKIYLNNGYTQIYSYQQWQFTLNLNHSITYILLIIQTINNVLFNDTYNNETRNFHVESFNGIIWGLLLCILQIWCNLEIKSAISDFGWFYGDFFLPNYITIKKLTNEGIYRYLNDPETVLGVAGIWGTVLMTNFHIYNITLAILWSITNFILVKFIEKPHMIKIYGKGKRISGISKALLNVKPIRRVSEIMDKVEYLIMKSILKENIITKKNKRTKHMAKVNENTIASSSSGSGSSSSSVSSVSDIDDLFIDVITSGDEDDEKSKNNEKLQYNIGLRQLIHKTMKEIKFDESLPNCELKVINSEDESDIENDKQIDIVTLPNEIKLRWQIPQKLYNAKDWICIYKIMDYEIGDGNGVKLGNFKRHSSRLMRKSSFSITNGHWKYAYKSTKVENDGTFISGETSIDKSQLHYSPGIYFVKYHQYSTNDVMMSTVPIIIKLPKFNSRDDSHYQPTQEDKLKFKQSLIEFLNELQIFNKDTNIIEFEGSKENNGNGTDNDHFSKESNFTRTNFCQLIKYNVNVELKEEFIMKTRGNLNIIIDTIWYIKKILNQIES